MHSLAPAADVGLWPLARNLRGDGGLRRGAWDALRPTRVPVHRYDAATTRTSGARSLPRTNVRRRARRGRAPLPRARPGAAAGGAAMMAFLGRPFREHAYLSGPGSRCRAAAHIGRAIKARGRRVVSRARRPRPRAAARGPRGPRAREAHMLRAPATTCAPRRRRPTPERDDADGRCWYGAPPPPTAAARAAPVARAPARAARGPAPLGVRLADPRGRARLRKRRPPPRPDPRDALRPGGVNCSSLAGRCADADRGRPCPGLLMLPVLAPVCEPRKLARSYRPSHQRSPSSPVAAAICATSRCRIEVSEESPQISHVRRRVISASTVRQVPANCAGAVAQLRNANFAFYLDALSSWG